MEQDYKEQLRQMTEGLGEWMDRREKQRRRKRVWLIAAAVVGAVVLQVFFPWRRETVHETVKYIYVNPSDSAAAAGDSMATMPSQSRTTMKATMEQKDGKVKGEARVGERNGFYVGNEGVRINAREGDEGASIIIDGKGVKIEGRDGSGHANIIIGNDGVKIEGVDADDYEDFSRSLKMLKKLTDTRDENITINGMKLSEWHKINGALRKINLPRLRQDSIKNRK